MYHIWQKISVSLLVSVVALSGGLLFFEREVGGLYNNIFSGTELQPKGEIAIAYFFAPQDLNPFTTNKTVRNRLYDVYEGLVKIDRDLNVEPALALTWGILDEKTWEFIIRPDVRFHDGTDLQVDDVIYSLEFARSSQLSGITGSIEKIESKENKVIVTTKTSDPLLLQKLAQIPIVPESFNDFERPNGTGKYLISQVENLDELTLEFSSDYWGNMADIAIVRILALPDKQARIDALLKGEIQFLAAVPPDAMRDLQYEKVKIASIPSLEVGFLMFNFDDRVFGKKQIREAIVKGINREKFLELADGYAETESQFVSSGVFGYNPEITEPQLDKAFAEAQVQKLSPTFQTIDVDFYYPDSLGLMGEFVQEELREIGLNVNLNPISAVELQQKIEKADMEFYFLGWRSELGDAISFLESVIDSDGEFNGAAYSNQVVDDLIERSKSNFNIEERLEDLQEAMRIIVEDDMIGVPLFETDLLYAFDQDLFFEPRVDGAIYPSDLSLNRL